MEQLAISILARSMAFRAMAWAEWPRNELVFLSPVYAVGFGDTVDFGTAFLTSDPPEGRSGTCADQG